MFTLSRFSLFVLISSFSVFGVSLVTMAGATKAGDGGHGVVCRKGKFGQTVSLLENTEARSIHGFSLTFGPSFGQVADWQDHEIYILPKAFMAMKERARVALDSKHPFLKTFDEANSIYLEEGELEESIGQTGDIGPIRIAIPAECELVQLAQRYQDGNKIRIELDAFYYHRLNLKQKGALILHEALHGWFGHQANTLAVREAVIYLMAPMSFRERNRAVFRMLVNTKSPQSFR